MITSAAPAAVPNLVQIRPWGASGWNIAKSFFFNLGLFSASNLQVRPFNGFSRLIAQTTRTRARVCILGFRWYTPFLVMKSPNATFGGLNNSFQAKRAKYWKFHIIETTASISTNFCTTIDHQVVIVGGPTTDDQHDWCLRNLVWWCKMGFLTAPTVKKLNLKIQDGGRRPFWKQLNRHISAPVWQILMKFGTMTHIGPLLRIDR